MSSCHTRKGYITEAVKIIEKEVFLNLNLNRIQICCDEQNLASKKLAIKCGYICEAVLRDQRFSEYHDEFHNGLIFSKLRSEFK